MVDGFSVLIVCTANQCRSPMAEHILRARVEEADLDWYVSSAGTHAVERSAIVPEASRILARRGIDATGFHSRRLTGELIAGADLILTAEQKQRERVAALGGRLDVESTPGRGTAAAVTVPRGREGGPRA